MNKIKISVAITQPLLKWLDLFRKETGESRSALITRLLIEAKKRK